MAMSEEQLIRMQRKLPKHRNRVAAYHFQLPAYMRMIHRFNAAKPSPIMNSYMVVHLEALMDLLSKVADFDGYQPPAHDEFDLRQLDVAFCFGCNHCNKTGFNARQVLEHVMNDDHPELPGYAKGKLKHFRQKTMDRYDAFLFRKKEIMASNDVSLHVLDRMIDFSLTTKSFLKMTSRFLSSLDILERAPSTIIARGVLDLLDSIDALLTTSKCVQSIPEFHSITHQIVTGEMKFVSKGKAFSDVHGALEHAVFEAGLRQAPAERNIFSLPQMVNKNPPQCLPNFAVPPPFLPAIQMMPPPPMMSASMVQVGVNMQVLNLAAHHHHQQQQQQNFRMQQIHQQQQHLLFNPSLVRMGPNVPSQPQVAQQHMAYQQRTGAVQLPPLNQSGAVGCPALNRCLINFLEQPQLDSLIENGNVLIHFDKSSVIPSEIISALKEVAPAARVECFGAKVSGIGYEDENVNLYVDNAKHPKTSDNVKEMFETLQRFFVANGDEWTIQNIHDADIRTHLTVKNNCENVCCRITFASEIYCYNTKLIRYYAETFPMYQKLCYFVQEFVKLIDIDLHCYIIVVLVLFYMQKRDYLPTVAQLQSRITEEIYNGHWLINFESRKPEKLKLKQMEMNLRNMATDIFLFYGKQFSFQESVVCPQIGLAINRSDFLPENMWRMSLKRYKAYVEECVASDSAERRDNFPQFDLTPMCVQDPLELTSNIAALVSSTDTGIFVNMCKLAYEFYVNNP
ncbi:uncharacterized protein LOC5576551 [Aedes aegypti]|uniref:Uncharacterized protein n=1 Tax=Aedes aegypti TaxID=7159 RepID=A0A6I8TM12_AEDAE|nr:uncharacterized protein LOC5576551 [Aedes aegypti]XP_021697854.1 uncharacterized protein LOC5576551 [Aedes aegypti]